MTDYDKMKVTDPAKRFKKSAGGMERRLVVSVEGTDKVGKTHFALTTPGDIGYLNFDRGLRGVVEKFHADKSVNVFPYEPLSQLTGQGDEAYDKAWAQFQADFRYSIRNFKTTVVDTMGEAWGMLRLAEFGKLTQVMPHHYTRANMLIKGLIDEVYDEEGKNLILIHSMKDTYENDKRTGKIEIDGFKKIYHAVQVAVRLKKEFTLADQVEEGDSQTKIFMEVKACRQNIAIEGEVLEGPGPMLNFSALAQMVFPSSKPGDWR